MIGAIAGDIIGSVFENEPIKTKEFPLFTRDSCFTDDSVATIAIAAAILDGVPYAESLRRICNRHPNVGYGEMFDGWLSDEAAGPYGSWGNGSAMRASPVAWAFDSEDEVRRQARMTAEVTHNHPEGIKGAEATALATFLARTGHGKELIRERIEGDFGYDLHRTVDDIRPAYEFEISCQETVPQALVAFLDSCSFEDAIRNAISLGGDADTLGCITGGIAEGFYGGVPEAVLAETTRLLAPDLRSVVELFRRRYVWGR